MLSDIEIASNANPLNISTVANALGIDAALVEPYGLTKAKIRPEKIQPSSKLVLVSAITPTTAGEGKTTVSIGLSDALCKIGKKSCVCLREPSLGPVFGMKGGAAGGGYAQVIPMEEINLHFTGDIHAISAANNLLAAMLDNHIFHGNLLGIDPQRIVLHRCIDLNDRALRSIMVGTSGLTRSDGFYITAASEVMAILCLANNLENLKTRLGNILVAYDYSDKPVFARDLCAQDAMAILLKEAFKPNLVQTLEGNPAFVHGGPFANIAHGCNSIIATKTAMTYADYVVTEAGFGADLGAEKFLNIKCRNADIAPSCVVIVASVRALRVHGGGDKSTASVEAVRAGIDNLKKHVENITKGFGLPAVVAINRFSSDSEEEISLICEECDKMGVSARICEVFQNGSEGGRELALEVARLCEQNPNPKIRFLYQLEDSIEEKIRKICQGYYGANDVVFSSKASADIKKITEMGYARLPVVIAKTQYSFSENPTLVGLPKNFDISVREVQLRSGSGFVVVMAGDIMLMPGLPKNPSATSMHLNSDGSIHGLS